MISIATGNKGMLHRDRKSVARALLTCRECGQCQLKTSKSSIYK